MNSAVFAQWVANLGLPVEPSSVADEKTAILRVYDATALEWRRSLSMDYSDQDAPMLETIGAFLDRLITAAKKETDAGRAHP